MLVRGIRTSVSVAALFAAYTVTSGAVQAQEPVLLDEVVVESANRDTRSLLDTTTAASVVSRDELERRDAATFEELIGDVPGLSIEGGPRGAAQEPNIRGFQDEQIVLRIDGGRFNFNQAHRGRFFVDPDIVERVEVIRGGGSTLQGSGALGGVISLETRDAYDLLDEGQTIGARSRTSFADNGSIFGQTATVYGAQDGFDALGFLAYRDMGEDLEDGSGTDIRASQIDVLNGLAKAGVEVGESGRIEGVFGYYSDDGITPSALDDIADGTNEVDRDTEVLTGRLSFDYDPVDEPLLNLSALAYFNTLEITEDRISDGRADKTKFDTYGFEIVNRSELDVGVPTNVVFGLEFVRDDQEGERNGGVRLQFPDAKITSYAGFIEASVEVAPGLTITPGVRVDRFELRPTTQPNRSETEILPRVGVSWRPNDTLQFYGNAARAFRAPSLTELYSDDVHFAVQGFPLDPTNPFAPVFTGVNRFVPTPGLEPEKSDQIEVGFRYSDRDVIQTGDRLTFALSGYYADVKDFIDTQVEFIDFNTTAFNPITGQVEVGGTTTSVNVDAELWGAEAELSYDAGEYFFGLGAAIPRGEDTNGATLGSLPQDKVTATLGLRPWAGVEIGARGTLAFERNSGGVSTDGYEVLDLFASYTMTSGPLGGARFSAGVDNVFDKTYNIHPNALNQTGRTFKGVVTLKF
ncbi:MAG: TonB-dependent receptor [Pseudomonadota bacterium]